jgi:hypothetical protein
MLCATPSVTVAMSMTVCGFWMFMDCVQTIISRQQWTKKVLECPSEPQPEIVHATMVDT